jgi:NitT/TauT family transport system substrate-binding protein
MQKVVVGVATPPGMTAANGLFSAASALGYDREEGLQFEMYYGDEPGTTAQALCAGKCDIASLNTTVGLIGRDKGLPMVAFYGKARRTHRWFAVVPGSPIRTLLDLKGKQIACDFDALKPLAEAALAEEGVPVGSFNWAPWHGSGMCAGGMVKPLRSGEVDAVFLIDWNDGDFIAEGLNLRRLPSKGLDRIKLSSCLWTTDRYLNDHSSALAGAGRALAKATAFALENPEAAVRLMWQEAPETRPGATEQAKVLRRDLAIMKARLACFGPDGDPKKWTWGYIDSQEIGSWQDFLIATQSIRERVPPGRLFTDQFVEVFNRFDADVVRARAHGFKPDLS